MRETFSRFWRQRSPSERRTLGVGGALLLVALLYAFVWYPLVEERQRLQATLPQLRATATQMRSDAADALRLRNAPQKSFDNQLRSALDSANAHSAIGAPSQFTPLDAGGARIVYDAVAFDDWFDWAQQLQAQHGVRVVSAQIVALAEPGMVKIQAVLAPAGARP